MPYSSKSFTVESLSLNHQRVHRGQGDRGVNTAKRSEQEGMPSVQLDGWSHELWLSKTRFPMLYGKSQA